jgi:thymidylate synthase
MTNDCPNQNDYYLVGRECYDADMKKAPMDRCKKRYDCEYFSIGRKLLDRGKWIKNKRTGQNCLTIVGDMMKFDLQDTDQFPILTTKKMNIKPIIGELLGFTRGYDNAEDFRKLNCKIWDANANDNEQWLNNPNRKGKDDLGRIYGVQARSRQTFFDVTPNIFEKPDKQKIPLPEFEKMIVDLSSNHSGLVGTTVNTSSSGPILICAERRTDTSHLVFDIKFINTGYVKKNVQMISLRTGNIKDPYKPNICDIAAYGVPKDQKLAELLRGTWQDMIYRCYSKDRRMNSVWYQDRGIFVDDRWLLFENFVEDFKKIDRWELKLEFPKEYSLDKDLYCSNKYSTKTCVWASKREQNINTRQAKKFMATSPHGDIYMECGIGNFCEKHSLNRRSVEMALANGVSIKGWKFNKVENENIRIRIDDQFAHAIAKIKHNPSDRRIIVDHWNPNELHMMALPPCHMNYSFTVENEYLHLTLYQRSCDFPIGIPFNIASYTLLLKLVANITGLKAGTFTHFMGNIHIYEDQYDLFKEQMKRMPKASPILEIPDVKTLEELENDVSVDDFKITEYDPDPFIKYPFSV